MSELLRTLLGDAINRVLRYDPDTLARLAEIESRRVRLSLAMSAGEPVEFDVLPTRQGMQLLPPGDAQPDVSISGSTLTFARLAVAGGEPRASGELTIRGDIELGNRFRAILERIDIDWEEPIAQVTGDIAAHQIGRAARAAAAQAREAGRTLLMDFSEYLREESRLAAGRGHVEGFLAAVDRLRDDAERLEKRLARIEEAL
jgi:ubiquinone biosynthesis protein UbiJ